MFLYVAGEDICNTLVQAQAITVSSEDADFVKANLHDQTSQPFRFSAAGLDDKITIDNNAIENGDQETWTLPQAPDEWEDESGTSSSISQELTLVRSGSSASKLTSASSSDKALLTYERRWLHGRTCNLEAYLRGDGSVNTKLYINLRETGQWLTSAGTWQTTRVAVATVSSAAGGETNGYTRFVVSAFVVDRIVETRYAVLTLRIEVEVDDTGDGYIDDISIWPSINFASIHGHNMGGVVTPEIRTSTDDFVANDTLRATLTPTRPNLYVDGSVLGVMVHDRYVRLKIVGTNHAATQIEELVFAQAVESPHAARLAYGDTAQVASVDNTFLGGGLTRDTLHADRFHTFTLGFKARNEADHRKTVEEICDASRWGQFPVFIVPDSNRRDVIMTKVPKELVTERMTLNVSTLEIVFREEPHILDTQ